MTNEHTVTVTALVASMSSADLRRQMKCNQRHPGKTELGHQALVEAEEKLMDEEITSVESTADCTEERDEDENKDEQAILNVALVKSVIQSQSEVVNGNHNSTNEITTRKDLNSLSHFGLRKRKHSADNKTQLPDQITSAKTIVVSSKSCSENASDASVIPVKIEFVETKLSNNTIPRRAPVSLKSTAINASVPDDVLSRIFPTTKSGTQRNGVKKPKRTRPSVRGLSNPVEVANTFTFPQSASYNLSVPNPLSKSVGDIPIPQPVSSSPIPAISSLDNGKLDVAPLSVPCPLPIRFPNTDTTEISSVDADYEADSKLRVKFGETTVQRDRGFSIDLDFALGYAEEQLVLNTNDTNLMNSCRDRAYSFECFAFGYNSSEPLPPLEGSSCTLTPDSRRPRGDSIIFDPSSFQDGGIHELTALERARSASIDNVDSLVDELLNGVSSGMALLEPVPPSDHSFPSLNTHHSFVEPTPVFASSESGSSVVPSMASLAPSAEISFPSPIIPAVASLPEDILNKDGRIGIYLPDARRDRIARFHSKRSKRIWRKRIKYDCRKKLADSRPRIKGRFVRRMEETEV